MKRRGTVVGIATGYGMDGRRVAVRVMAKATFSPLHVVQTLSGCWVATSPGVKRPERDANQSPSTSAEVMNTWIYTSTPLPHTSSWGGDELSTRTTFLLFLCHPSSKQKRATKFTCCSHRLGDQKIYTYCDVLPGNATVITEFWIYYSLVTGLKLSLESLLIWN
jgi:hypothetical protein